MNELRLGLTSVTFRNKTVDEILGIMEKSGLRYIEWGTDVHAKSEDDARAIRALCDERGVQTISLGSYYRVGDGDLPAFEADCRIADILGANRIRVWLGRKSSCLFTDEEKRAMLSEVRSLADIAGRYGITLAFEFHRKTLNDCGESCVEFLKALGDERVKTYWQPFFEGNDTANLDACLGFVDAVHVFSWDAAAHRFPLDAKADEWREFVKTSREVCGDYILEFVVNDDEEMFMRDAKTLKSFFE